MPALICLYKGNTLVYSLLSSAVSVSLHCLWIWIKLCWISRCLENLGGPGRPRRTCSKWASFKRNISHSAAQKMPGHRRRSQVRLGFEASIPRAACSKQNSQFSQSVLPPATPGPPASALPIQTRQQEKTKQTDWRCAAPQKITANQASR